MNVTDPLAHVLSAGTESGRYWLVVKADDGVFGAIPLILQGDETEELAVSRFRDALCASRQELAARGGWYPTNAHIDGRPRTELELAHDAMLKKAADIGWDAISDSPEYQRVVALMSA